MSEYTPGPWTVGKDGDGNTVVSTMPKPSDILPGASEWWNVAIVMGTPGKRDKQANARLMAAAPDMLQALEAMEWANAHGSRRYCPACNGLSGQGHFENCIISSAIAKAKGEAS